MRKKNIFVLFLVCVILLGFAFLINRNDNKKNELERSKIEVESLQKILIQHNTAEKESISFVQQNGLWKIAVDSNIDYSVPADQESVFNLLNQLSEVQFEKVVSERKGPYFLSIRYGSESQNSLINIEESKNFEGKYFSALTDGQTALIGPEFVQFISRDFIFFQEKHPLNINSKGLEFIAIGQQKVESKDHAAFLGQINKMTVQKYIRSSAIDKSAESRSIQIHLKNQFIMLNLYFKDKLQGEILISEDQKYFVEFDMTYWAYFANYHLKEKK